MSREANDGGAAFAAMGVGPAGDIYHEHGMSLRDWLASQAPVDFDMARQAAKLGATVSPESRLAVWGAMAILRFEYADAMLAARDRGGQA